MDNDTSDTLRDSLGANGEEGLGIRLPPPAISIELRRHPTSTSSRPRARSSPTYAIPSPPSSLIVERASFTSPSPSVRSRPLSQSSPRSPSIGQQPILIGIERTPRISSTPARSRLSRDDIGETIPGVCADVLPSFVLCLCMNCVCSTHRPSKTSTATKLVQGYSCFLWSW